jgi:DNA-binding Lrp family transcriptional regulator
MRKLPVKPRLDALDACLLTVIQREVPLVPRPFHALARRLGVSGEEVLRRVNALKKAGIVRQVSAIFDANALGYKSALVAVKCPRGRDAIAAVVSKHPGVSHNYGRDHRFGLWFTIAVAPDRDLAREVARLMQRSGAIHYIVLPALRVFKIRVTLDLGAENEGAEGPPAPRRQARARKLTASQTAAVRALQRPLPIVERPFLALSRGMGASGATGIAISEPALLLRAKRLLSSGIMRRFAAVLGHQRVGYTANAMAVWQVPENRIARAGKVAASFGAVSHCYQRATAPGWPYNLFAMIHGRARADCLRVADQISAKIGNPPRALLFTTREYKKSRPLYFL